MKILVNAYSLLKVRINYDIEKSKNEANRTKNIEPSTKNERANQMRVKKNKKG